jgi:hypothetical protein
MQTRLLSSRENLGLRGEVSIFEEVAKGVRRRIWKDANLIVNGGKQKVALLLSSNPPSADNVITFLKAGTLGHETGDPETPVAPLVTDTALEDPDPIVISNPVVSFLDSGKKVKFLFVMDKAVGNGAGSVKYTEIGAFTADGTMFARHTFPYAKKDAYKRLHFEWVFYS